MIVISLISSIIFGIIDALFFLIAEDTLQKKLVKINFVDNNMAELMTGGISASFAIFISNYIKNILERHHHLIEHPLIDASGIIIGTLLIIFLYYIQILKKIYAIEKKIKDDI